MSDFAGKPKRRDEILEVIIEYAIDRNGVTPSIAEIARIESLSYSTTYEHIRKLEEEGKITIRDGKIILPNSSLKFD